MYTIKEASSRSGIPIASLRAWERRYGIVAPRRSEGGYRLYDDDAIAALVTMRRLVDEGWTPANAAAALASGEITAAAPEERARTSEPDLESVTMTAHPEAASLTQELVDAAALAVVYLGADLPVAGWQRAVQAFPTRVAVIGVPTPEDRRTAAETAQTLLRRGGDLVVAAGGGHGDQLAPGVAYLDGSITAAARTVEQLRT